MFHWYMFILNFIRIVLLNKIKRIFNLRDIIKIFAGGNHKIPDGKKCIVLFFNARHGRLAFIEYSNEGCT